MRILIVEDDEGLLDIMRLHLELEGYTVDACTQGDDGLRWARQRAHDLVLLDRLLPSLDGMEVLRRLRAEEISVPVLMVTALGAVDQRVGGLDAGADDYLIKPFAMKELLARVRAMCRRPRPLEDAGVLVGCGVRFYKEKKLLQGPAGDCRLSAREAALLEVLLRNPGQVLPRALLLSRVWGPDAPVEDGNLDSYVHFLRAHLRQAGCAAEIKTVRGVGYTLQAPHA